MAAVEPPVGHNSRCPSDQGGITEEDSAEEQHRYLSRQEGEWCTLQLFWEGTILRTFPRRNYYGKEALTSQEGCISLDERGDPRLLRRPRHKRKQERDILLMPLICTLSDNGILCPGYRVSIVPQLKLMLDPSVRSITCLSLYAPTLIVRIWA